MAALFKDKLFVKTRRFLEVALKDVIIAKIWFSEMKVKLDEICNSKNFS